MTLIRRSAAPFGDLLSLRQAMDHLFEESLVNPRTWSWGEPHGVALDVYATDEDLVVEANLPGVKPEEVDITVEGNALSIAGDTTVAVTWTAPDDPGSSPIDGYTATSSPGAPAAIATSSPARSSNCSAPETPMLRYAHTGLTCADLAATELFYTKHFGFRRARVVDLGGRRRIGDRVAKRADRKVGALRQQHDLRLRLGDLAGAVGPDSGDGAHQGRFADARGADD